MEKLGQAAGSTDAEAVDEGGGWTFAVGEHGRSIGSSGKSSEQAILKIRWLERIDFHGRFGGYRNRDGDGALAGADSDHRIEELARSDL